MKQNTWFDNKSIRLKNYDYNYPGAYFVTICVSDHKCMFGDVVEGKMILNELGKIADRCLTDIPNHFDATEIPIHIIMPNHVHAVVNIYEEDNRNSKISVGGRYTGRLQVGQRYIFDLQKKNKRKYQKLPLIVSTYKAAVTREIHKLFPTKNFKWQTSYHDHIIRNEKALENIYYYIKLNPENWYEDLENEMYLKNISFKEREKKIKLFYKNLAD